MTKKIAGELNDELRSVVLPRSVALLKKKHENLKEKNLVQNVTQEIHQMKIRDQIRSETVLSDTTLILRRKSQAVVIKKRKIKVEMTIEVVKRVKSQKRTKDVTMMVTRQKVKKALILKSS